jgi:hypothetical protein
MDSTFSPRQSEPHQGTAGPRANAMTRSSLNAMIMVPSLSRRASRGLARFLVVFCIGVANLDIFTPLREEYAPGPKKA